MVFDLFIVPDFFGCDLPERRTPATAAIATMAAITYRSHRSYRSKRNYRSRRDPEY